jgi:acetyl-CoA hydrolase
MEGHVRHNALFIGANVRAAVQEGRADFTPVFLSEIPGLFQSGQLPVDLAVLHVSPPDRHGFCSLGVSVDVALAAVGAARCVIAQLNRQMPRTHGESSIHISRIDALVETDEPIIPVQRPQLTAAHHRIAEQVSTLVGDGTTIQLGIGAVAEAVLQHLGDHRDLGVHTEMFSDGVVDLVEKGVITGARKPVHPGLIISSFVMGSQRLYDFVDDNHMVAMYPSHYTNDLNVIAAHGDFVAVNSAIEVDVTGQVCADSIGGRFFSGIGGQLDFIRGAARAPRGRPVIALPATAADGTVSRIVPHLSAGAGVVTTRGDVEFVVTEYGTAQLHGKTVRERARALIGLAAPRFREALAREAYRLYGVTPE